ncbi:MAG TPA: DNA polymerase III subunit chi, partial [Verrucomicrobiae bacterium]|nr:DNA polymerase III subunit chi [Verrucomicrobiae bacterium]
ANVRFFVDRAIPRDTKDYERLVFMFDGHDPEAVQQARIAWKALAGSNALTYWQQETGGGWVNKA